ncbi:MAG: phosphatidate phosphatase App1 family protein [Myxococcaceae bacterium]
MRSGEDGEFQAMFNAPDKSPYLIGSALAEAHVAGASAQAQVQIVADDAPFLLISDFDDTVAISNVLQVRKVLRTALLQDETTQSAVEGMAPLYHCLLSEKSAVPAMAVVSGSPVQFAPRMAAFLRRNGFPFSGLYLRKWAPSTLSNYKQPVIRKLLKLLPHPVVLVGDSGEHDPEVYAQIRREHPDRVKRIYIRDAGKSADKARFEGMVLFKTADQAARDAVAQGLMSEACLTKTFPAALSADGS